ncbi:MAG: choice-of-anchor J domain-containing protein [Bacteroidales bacterium]|nr:choice-of-anchor J domain-containing protein [Bacteroidales bacterium]
MKKKNYAFSLAVLLMYCLTGISQTTIWSEDFPYADGTTQGSGNPPKWTLETPSSPDWWEVRSNQMEGKELDAEAVWTSESIDISGFSDVEISLDISEEGNMNNNDYIRIYYRINGDPTEILIDEYVNDFGTASPSITNLNGYSLVVVVRARNDNNQHYHRFDNVVVAGTPISNPPVADFTVDDATPEVGQTISFTDLSSNNPTSWNWSFNPSTITFVGGTDQYSQNPQVTFDASGNYSVTLTATNVVGSDDETKSGYVSPAPVLMSNGTVTTCEGTFFDSGGETGNYGNGEDLSLTFYPAISGNMIEVVFTAFEVQAPFANPIDYLNIYDGEDNSATLIGQYYGTDSPGTVTASNAAGALTFEFISNNWYNLPGWEANITCVAPPVPVADFTADILTPGTGHVVQFTDLSTNVPTTWAWSITPATYSYTGGTNSASQNPQVIFNNSGFYSVTLTASNVSGSDNETKTDYIYVTDCSIVSFPWTEEFDNGGLIPICWLNVDQSGSGKLWEFNNPGGRTINTTSASNGFAIFDSDNYGENTGAEDCDLISPTFNFSGETYAFIRFEHFFEANYGGAAEFAISTNGGSSWTSLDFWEPTSTGNPEVEIYDVSSIAAGQSSVHFRWKWTGDWSWWWAIDDIMVSSSPLPNAPPVADFSADNTSPAINETVTFTDLSTEYPDTWAWNISPATFIFTGGTTSGSQNPQIEFTANGFYTVELTATNILGSDTEIKTSYINVGCDAIVIPWSEDFNTGGVIPFCWQNNDNAGNGEVWEFDNPGNLSFNSTSAANGFAIFDSDNYGDNGLAEDCDLISPAFDLSGETVTYLKFEHYFRQGYGGQGELFYSTNGGSSWTSLEVWNSPSTGNAETEVYDLSGIVTGYSNVLFRWNWTGDYSWYWAVDDVVLDNHLPVTGDWTGVVNSDWNNTGNWAAGSIPGLSSDINIPSGVPNFPIIDESAWCANLIIEDGAQVTIITGGNLTVSGDLTNGEGSGGWFQIDDGMCSVSGDYYTEIGSTTDINGGTWSFSNWYRNSTTVWSKGTIELSGGTINASGSVIWSNFDVFGKMDGPVVLNVGGTFRNSNDDWTFTDGTINMYGTDGAGPFYFMASSWGAGNYAAAYNLNIEGAVGTEFRTNPDDDVTGAIIYNNLTVTSGFFHTDGNTGFMNDALTVGGDFTVGAEGEVTANVSDAFNVAGDAYIEASETRIGSFIDNQNTNIVGSSNVQQHVSSMRWHLVSSPVTGATIYTYLNIWLKEFDEPTDSWNYLVQPTTIPMNTTQGYSAWADDGLTGSKTVTYTGVFNTGDQALPLVSYTPTSSSMGWNLIGNPYPSGLQWNDTWAKSGISEWGCIHNNGNDGCYNALTGEEWPLPGDFPNGTFGPTQGFWVRATGSTSSLTIPHNQRMHSSQAIYKNGKMTIDQQIRMKVTGNDDYDALLLQFIPEATNGFDEQFDLEKRWGYSTSPNMYAITEEGEYFSVNALPEVYPDLVIPVGMEVGVAGEYMLDMMQIKGIGGDVIVILEDIKEGTFRKLMEGTTYTFMADPEDEPHRFNLLFKDIATGEDLMNEEITYMYSYEDVIYILGTPENLRKVTVYDLMGSTMFESTQFSSDVTPVTFNNKTGYYVVRLQTADGVVSKKVFLR